MAVASLLKPEEVKELVKPILLSLADDKSWRVRYMTADKLCEVSSVSFLEEIWKTVAFLFVPNVICVPAEAGALRYFCSECFCD